MNEKSFEDYFNEYFKCQVPETFNSFKLMIDSIDIAAVISISNVYNSICPHILTESNDTKHDYSAELSYAHIQYLMTTYCWDIYDRIFEIAVTVNNMTELSRNISSFETIIRAIADATRAKELFIFVMKKLVLVPSQNDSFYVLTLLLYSLQLALIELPNDGVYLSSGLALVLQILIKKREQIVSESSRSVVESNWDEVLSLCLSLYDNIHNKSKTWNNSPNVMYNFQHSPSEGDLKQAIHMVGYLLNASGKIVAHCTIPSWRAKAMNMISQRILSNFLSLDDILVYPFRLRYRVLRNKIKQIQNDSLLGQSQNKSVKRLRSTVLDNSDEVIDYGLFNTVPIQHRSQLISMTKSYLSKNLPNQVYNSTESKSKLPTNIERRSQSNWAEMIPWMEVMNHGNESLPQSSGDDRKGTSSFEEYMNNKIPWDFPGLTMFAQSVLSSSAWNTSNDTSLLSTVYSPQHVYDMFSVFLRPLLQDSRLGLW